MTAAIACTAAAVLIGYAAAGAHQRGDGPVVTGELRDKAKIMLPDALQAIGAVPYEPVSRWHWGAAQ